MHSMIGVDFGFNQMVTTDGNITINASDIKYDTSKIT